MSPTVPGNIPGLLRRGSPVLVRDHEVHDRAFGGVVLAIVGGDPFIAITDGPAKLIHLPIRIVALDLSDATSRVHAAWWLVATLWPEELNRHEWVWSRWSGTDGHWQLGPPGAIPQRWSGYKSSVYRYHGFVPELSDLNYRDPRLLPDGSRWVDAEALRRVVLHVAGRPL